jgi:hypothetical protein
LPNAQRQPAVVQLALGALGELAGDGGLDSPGGARGRDGHRPAGDRGEVFAVIA